MTSTAAELNNGDDWLSHQSDRDDIAIIRKTIVMGESEEPATSQLQVSQGIVQALKRGSDGVKTGEMPDKANGCYT